MQNFNDTMFNLNRSSSLTSGTWTRQIQHLHCMIHVTRNCMICTLARNFYVS